MIESGRLVAEVGLQDGIGLDDVFWFCAGALVVIGLVRLFLDPIIKAIKEDRAVQAKFHRDFYGEPADSGRDAVPGVMERLQSIDGELKRNGGKSVKDTVNRTERKVDMLAKIAKLNAQATAEAFKAAGLEPPMLQDFPDMVEGEEPEGTS